MAEKPYERLERFMNRRRIELGMTWSKVAGISGVAIQTISAVRKGVNEPSALTRGSLERALQWRHGSIDAVLSGGEPTPLKTTESERPPGDEIGELLADIKRLALRAQRLEAERRETDSSHRDEDTA